MFTLYQKGNLKLFAGTVEGEPQIFERDGVRNAMITLRDYKGECVKVFFRNGAEGSPKSEMRADRIISAKVTPGAFLTVLAYCSDEKQESATGRDFKYRGRWKFKGENGETTVLMGNACRPRSPKDDMYCITIPVDDYLNGEKRTIWVDVTFFDGEYNGRTQENAKFAKKVMYQHENETPMVVVTGGSMRERQYNGKTYYNIVGYRITRKPE